MLSPRFLRLLEGPLASYVPEIRSVITRNYPKVTVQAFPLQALSLLGSEYSLLSVNLLPLFVNPS
jgi:hypothetical protein